MDITNCTKADFDHILSEIADFWGDERTLYLHHPIFLYQFGDTAYVIRDGETVAAYLFGFIAPAGPTAYVHLVAVRRSYRGQGLGRRLHAHFLARAQDRGCGQAQAITSPGNLESICFHRALGMEMVGVVPDYAGPGRPRVVFRRRIGAGDNESGVAEQ